MADKILRRPPAYQVYAADDLAASRYYPLSAGERGVLDSMLRACWVDDTVPSNPRLLALVLRLQESDLGPFLSAEVLAHFEQDGGEPGRLRSPELTRQMTNLMEVRKRQRQGGKEGAKITNAARVAPPRATPRKGSRPPASPGGRPESRPTSSELNGDEENKEEQKQSLRDGSSRLSPEQAEWRRAYIDPEVQSPGRRPR